MEINVSPKIYKKWQEHSPIFKVARFGRIDFGFDFENYGFFVIT